MVKLNVSLTSLYSIILLFGFVIIKHLTKTIQLQQKKFRQTLLLAFCAMICCITTYLIVALDKSQGICGLFHVVK
jgi:hypothetical protein